MKHFSISLLFALLFIGGCKKDSGTIYIRGEIKVRIEWKATAKQFFELCNGYSLRIKQMRSFEYSSPYDADSMDAINEYVLARPYMRESDIGGKTLLSLDSNGKVMMKMLLLDVNAADQADFLDLLDRWQFTDLNVGTKAATLIVPVGEEEYWCDLLEKNSLVRWAYKNDVTPIMN